MMRYEVRTIQEIPYADFDDNGEMICGSSTGRTEVYIAGRFTVLHLAKMFASELEAKIAEKAGYTVNCFTPRVKIVKVDETETEVECCA